MIEQNCVHASNENDCQSIWLCFKRQITWVVSLIGCWCIVIAGFWSSRLCKASAAEWCLLWVVCSFQSVFGRGSMFVNLTLEVSPQKGVARSQIWQARGLWVSPSQKIKHPGKISLKAAIELFAVWAVVSFFWNLSQTHLWKLWFKKLNYHVLHSAQS